MISQNPLGAGLLSWLSRTRLKDNGGNVTTLGLSCVPFCVLKYALATPTVNGVLADVAKWERTRLDWCDGIGCEPLSAGSASGLTSLLLSQ